MKSVYITPLLVLALAAAPYRASAEPAEARSSAAAEASGRAHFQRGQRLSARGDYAAAYREFEAGYAATARPLFLFNMAEAARASGDAVKARTSYLAFLRADPGNALAATARARLAELDRTAGAPADDPGNAGHGDPAALPGAAPGPSHSPALPMLPPSAIRSQPASPEALPREPRATPGSRADGGDTGDRPMWKRWPFWAVIGGAIAGGAALYAVRHDSGPCGTGCSEINFR
jgi:tetratricopeptide (TPR) repeat protein